MARVVVAGGGLAGCAAALALAEADCQVVLVEKRAQLGGRASSYRAAGWDKPLDNCQHVLLGCCTNQLDLYRRIGVLDRITWHDRVPLLAADGRRGSFAACPLPPPLHLAPALALLPGLSPLDRLQLALALGRMVWGGRDLERLAHRTFADWLGSTTTPALDRGFWRLMIASVLNAEPHEVSARYALFFFLDGLMRHRDAFRLGVPQVPLGALHDDAMRTALRNAGVEVRCRGAATVTSAGRARVAIDGEPLGADAVVCAVHWRQLAGLMPGGLARRVAGVAPDQLGASPLVGVHLGLDAPVLDEAVVGFLGADVDWLMSFDGGRHLSVSVSAAASWQGMTHEQRVARALAALRQFWPELPDPARTASCLVPRATIVPGPGIDAVRPGPRTSVPGLYLAGCWTATGWPSTMESAVRSGYAAAEAVLADLGAPRTVRVPDLPAAGLMRWLRR